MRFLILHELYLSELVRNFLLKISLKLNVVFSNVINCLKNAFLIKYDSFKYFVLSEPFKIQTRHEYERNFKLFTCYEIIDEVGKQQRVGKSFTPSVSRKYKITISVITNSIWKMCTCITKLDITNVITIACIIFSKLRFLGCRT